MLIPCNERLHCEIIYKHVQQLTLQNKYLDYYKFHKDCLRNTKTPNGFREPSGYSQIADDIIPEITIRFLKTSENFQTKTKVLENVWGNREISLILQTAFRIV